MQCKIAYGTGLATTLNADKVVCWIRIYHRGFNILFLGVGFDREKLKSHIKGRRFQGLVHHRGVFLHNHSLHKLEGQASCSHCQANIGFRNFHLSSKCQAPLLDTLTSGPEYFRLTFGCWDEAGATRAH
ncbi:hypothetical protein TWF481_010535 [Arthrobotrys musiformis]|uniref:Uncharacterized protein n=1 Tax=Arthrobotrys musiformis TaxID=47236 RepID=A0AAV9W184_9PEZI